MNLKFYMWLVDILSFVMVLIPFIYHMLSLIYDFLKLIHVWLTSLSMLKLALTFWFSLTIFPWSNWAEILYACHVMDCDWAWIIWWFLELFELTFDASHSVDFCMLPFAIFWLQMFMKWWWCMIWLWAQLWLLSNWLTLTSSWLFLAALTFSSIFDPRLALVVLWTYVEFICFRLSTMLQRSLKLVWIWFVYPMLTFVLQMVWLITWVLCFAQLIPCVDCLPLLLI